MPAVLPLRNGDRICQKKPPQIFVVADPTRYPRENGYQARFENSGKSIARSKASGFKKSTLSISSLTFHR